MKQIKTFDFDQSKIIHVFEYYDFPLFFVSKSSDNELLLNYYIEDINENTNKWLFSRITNNELSNLINQNISVLDLLSRLLSNRRLYHLYVDSSLNKQPSAINLELVEDSNFDKESFPDEDFHVEFDYITKTKLYKVEQDLLDSSKFKMVLKDEENNHDIGLDMFLDILNNLKNSINGIAYDVGNKLVDQQRNHSINLRIDSLQPSSFGVFLRTEQSDVDLFEVPEKSLNNLFEILDDIKHISLSELEDKVEIDQEYSLETIKNVSNMLKEIADNNFSLAMEANTKYKKEQREVKFTKEFYNNLNILREFLSKKSEKIVEDITVEGTLTSINIKRNRFSLSTKTEGEIGGKMSKELFNKVKNDSTVQFRVPSQIKAVIKKEAVKDFLEENFDEKYTLIHYEQLLG